MALIREARNRLKMTFLLVGHPKATMDPFKCNSISISRSPEIFSDRIWALKATGSLENPYPAQGHLTLNIRKNRGGRRGFYHLYAKSMKFLVYNHSILENRSACLTWKGRKTKIFLKILFFNF